ncbi:hypothetical protein ACIRU5_01525 [Streptomyces misionensis]|uniref:hypothetical protein n=1 Tax=Streptomyces misionensis TaxID=67331 RepID=UPI00380ABF51
MDEYAWPAGSEAPEPEAVRQSWVETVVALPVGSHVGGEVIGRQRFGVFIRVEGIPNAVALAEITVMPRGMELPPLGAHVEGAVIGHAHHNHQVQIRLPV